LSTRSASYADDPHVVAGCTVDTRLAASFGLRLSVIEGYLPLDKIILGQPGRDEQIAEILRLIIHMGRLGIPELLIILAIIILIFGANRLPEIGRGIGKGIRNFKDSTKDGAEEKS